MFIAESVCWAFTLVKLLARIRCINTGNVTSRSNFFGMKFFMESSSQAVYQM